VVLWVPWANGYQLVEREVAEHLRRGSLVMSTETDTDDFLVDLTWQLESLELERPSVDAVEGSWNEVAPRIRALECDALKFTDRAKAMLAPGNPYKDPVRMYDFVERLTRAATAWRDAGMSVGQRLESFVMDLVGIEIALQSGLGESFVFDGVMLINDPHVKVDDYKWKDPARCGRIYFALDTEKARFVVDYVGTHG
jgi:hypothetical protein